jgi:hypothetical protein
MLEAGVFLRPFFFWLKESFEKALFVSPSSCMKIRSAMHLNNSAGSSSNISGADFFGGHRRRAAVAYSSRQPK